MTNPREVVAGEMGFERAELWGYAQEGTDPASVRLRIVFPGSSGWSSFMTPSEARKVAAALVRAADKAEGRCPAS